MQQLIKKIMQEPLIYKPESLKSILRIPENVDDHSIYYGTGISKPSIHSGQEGELTAGIPLDILIYILIAAKLNEVLNKPIHHLLADNHALLNLHKREQVSKVVYSYRNNICNYVNNLKIDDYHVYLASDVATNKQYKAITNTYEKSSFNDAYSHKESSDTEHFTTTRGPLIKLGWKFPGHSSKDEVSFDSQYEEVMGRVLPAIYVHAGKRLNDKKPNAVPYTIYQDELSERFLLSPDEDIKGKIEHAKCSKQTLKAAEKHYKRLIRLFEEVVTEVPRGLSTWAKLQYIIDFTTY